MNASAPISVLLVEDHALLRMGIKASLASDKSISIVGESANGADAIEKAASLNPDVIVMDISMPIMDGIESTRRIKLQNSNAKIIVLSSHDEREAIFSALSSGARGYCRKDLPTSQLSIAIQAVHEGEIWLDPSLSNPSLCQSGFRVNESPTSAFSFPISKQEQQLVAVFAQNQTQPVSLNSSLAGTSTTNLNDKYERLGFLGKGGMSVVHKVRHRLLDKVFAIKFLGSTLPQSDSSVQRFTIEAKITSQLSHPNIVSVHDYGVEADGRPYLVMDFVDGPTIADVLKCGSRIPEDEARRIFQQIAKALAHAHSRGIIHRDIKPSNVILTR